MRSRAVDLHRRCLSSATRFCFSPHKILAQFRGEARLAVVGTAAFACPTTLVSILHCASPSSMSPVVS
jgi:hypothetical protein